MKFDEHSWDGSDFEDAVRTICIIKNKSKTVFDRKILFHEILKKKHIEFAQMMYDQHKVDGFVPVPIRTYSGRNQVSQGAMIWTDIKSRIGSTFTFDQCYKALKKNKLSVLHDSFSTTELFVEN